MIVIDTADDRRGQEPGERTPRRVRLRELDLDGIVADYQNGVRVADICARWDVPLTRLYRILDDHNVARRKGIMGRIPVDIRRQIAEDYRAGAPIRAIADRRVVSTNAVSEIAYRAAASRGRQRDRDTIIELVVSWLAGEPTSDAELDAIQRVGVNTRARGLSALDSVDSEIRGDVARHLVEIITDRWIVDQH